MRFDAADGLSEADWLHARTPQQNASWANDKVTMNQKLLQRFNVEKQGDERIVAGRAAGPGEFVIAVNVDRYDGQFQWTARIRDAAGAALDEIGGPRLSSQRINTWFAEEMMAASAAPIILKYLRDRAAPR